MARLFKQPAERQLRDALTDNPQTLAELFAQCDYIRESAARKRLALFVALGYAREEGGNYVRGPKLKAVRRLGHRWEVR